MSAMVRQLRLLSFWKDIELHVLWMPREEEHQMVAAMWCKRVDEYEWILKRSVCGMLIAQKALQGRKPGLRVFARNPTTKVSGCFV